MSDYFGALMRSGAMAVAGGAPVIAELRTVEPSVVEIDAERSPPAVATHDAQAPPLPRQAAAPVPVAHAVDPPVAPAAPVTVAGTDTTPAAQTGFTPAPRAHLSATSPGPPGPLSAETAPAAEAPKPALGQALVHAAMRWVVADPQQADSFAQAPPRVRSSPTAADATSVIATAPAYAAAQPHGAVPTHPTANQSIRALDLPVRSARPSPATTTQSVAAFAADERVEISIGAIHVRVDAPTAQTIARQPVAPPAAPRRAAPAAAPRSALSRRALRRI